MNYKRLLTSLLLLGGFVVVISLVTLLVGNSAKSSQKLGAAASSEMAAPSSSSSHTVLQSASPKPDTEAEKGGEFQHINQQMQALTEAYYLVTPDDTEETRRQRLSVLGLQPEQLEKLNLAVGTLSCGDRLRLDVGNPLIQKAFVSLSDIKVNELPNGSLYVVANAVVSLYGRDGMVASGSETCRTSQIGATFTTWQRVEGEWKLMTFGAREVIL